jgi:hypothetical protein
VEVLSLTTSGVASRQTFDHMTPIASRALPAFSSTPGFDTRLLTLRSRPNLVYTLGRLSRCRH